MGADRSSTSLQTERPPSCKYPKYQTRAHRSATTLPALHGFSGSCGHRKPFRRPIFFFPRSLPPQQLNVIPAVRPHFPSAGLISRKLFWLPAGDSSCLALPSCRGMQTFPGNSRASAGSGQSRNPPLLPQECKPWCISSAPALTLSLQRLPQGITSVPAGFAHRSCSRDYSSAAQPRCSRDGVRWSLEVLCRAWKSFVVSHTAWGSPHTLVTVFAHSRDGGRVSMSAEPITCCNLEIKSSSLL